MSKPEPGEWADEVVAFAKSRGYRVTTEMRTDYHHAGVLPRPRVVGLGRGRGVRALYPLGTSLQLARLCQLVKQTHSVRISGAIMWLQGYRVDTSVYRSMMMSIVNALEDLVGPPSSDLVRDGQVVGGRPAIHDAISRLDSGKRLKGTPLAQIRKAIGRERFMDLLYMAFERMAEPDGPLVPGDMKAVAELRGLQHASDAVLQALAEDTRPMPPAAMRALLASLTDEQLCRIRDEVKTVLVVRVATAGAQQILEARRRGPTAQVETSETTHTRTPDTGKTTLITLVFTLMQILEWAAMKQTAEGRAQGDAILAHCRHLQQRLPPSAESRHQ